MDLMDGGDDWRVIDCKRARTSVRRVLIMDAPGSARGAGGMAEGGKDEHVY